MTLSKALKSVLLGLSLLLLLALAIGCSDKEAAPIAADPAASQNQWTLDNPLIQAAVAVQERHTAELMKNSEVVGTAVSVNEAGQPVILVLAKSATLQKGPGGIPAELESVPLVIEVTGVIKAMKTTTVKEDPKVKQTPPIKLGTSGGWSYDLANGYCCGGTLGSLIQSGGRKYVLSNYHVLQADIVDGGNGRVAQTGDPVVQPGLIDIGCLASSGQTVANLAGAKSLPGSNVDAAIAEIVPGMVSPDGAILNIGTLSASTVGAAVNQTVKKMGRTTSLTRSTVSGLNASVSITYENECAGGTSFTKTFSGQILIANKVSRFLAGGDSGSLLVEDITTKPRAVGLLFAGSTSIAIANPINEVLGFFNATMVGN